MPYNIQSLVFKNYEMKLCVKFSKIENLKPLLIKYCWKGRTTAIFSFSSLKILVSNIYLSSEASLNSQKSVCKHPNRVRRLNRDIRFTFVILIFN